MGSSMASLLVHGTRWCIVHCHGSFVIWYYITLIKEKYRRTDSSYNSYNKMRNTESSFEINFFILTIPSLSLFIDAVVTTLILFLLSKSAISASFLIIYPFAGELYPTQLRGVAIGFSAYISGLGLIIIPFVTYLVSNRKYAYRVSAFS